MSPKFTNHAEHEVVHDRGWLFYYILTGAKSVGTT